MTKSLLDEHYGDDDLQASYEAGLIDGGDAGYNEAHEEFERERYVPSPHPLDVSLAELAEARLTQLYSAQSEAYAAGDDDLYGKLLDREPGVRRMAERYRENATLSL